ncbi:hypothetical protein J2T19_000457 [Paenibacillus tundrae]|uniref:Uncharacterized protein n=1 Tax=Paenibacillus tundrae TaxID=528187 RepID=A0ABT9W851_9BACL|nr:hypothetical protein [Paenibacillus tundrae]
MKVLKQCLFLFLAVILVITPISSVSANDTAQDDIYPADSREENIKNLMTERAMLQLKLNDLQENNNNDSNTTELSIPSDLKIIKEYKELSTKIQQIDNQLYDLGVRDLSEDELAEKLKLSDEGALAVVPGGYSNVSWRTYRSIWVKNSVRYEVQHIVASPAGTASSSISQSGTVVQTTNGGIRAAGTGLLKTTAKEGASLIPGVDIGITIYDALKQALTDFSSTTEVTNITSSYNWDYNMNVDFMYVKKEGQSDISQVLSFRSSEVFGAASWSIRNVGYKKGTNIVTSSNFITDSRRYHYTPSNHGIGSNAVTAYLNPGSASTAFVSNVDFTGIDGKVFKSVSLPRFSFPSQIQDK